MALSISRVSVGSGDMDEQVFRALEELGAPEGEEWTARVTAATPTAAWEVVFEGAPRDKSAHVDWEILQADGRARFRKLFAGRDEKNVDCFKRAARNLVWESVQFRENPIRTVSPALAETYEEAVWGQLRHEDMNPVQVRFGIWRDGPDGMRFVCKVEYASERRVPWTWWSGLVRNPSDLSTELQRALMQRRKRQYVSGATLAALRRRPARPRAAVAAPAPALTA